MSAIGRISPVPACIVTPAAAVTPFPRHATEPSVDGTVLDNVPYTVVEPGETASVPRDPHRVRAASTPPPRGTTARPGRTATQLAALRAYLPRPDYRGLYVDVQV